MRLDVRTPIKGFLRAWGQTLIPATQGRAVMSEEDEELDEDDEDEEGWGDEEETEE
ncbi:MAG TPA: hypothetical protein VED22_03260 [Nitrososphaerales archaeon]|nr:hypothetical protein [Nitrososphaerales archaeon]